MDTDKLKYVVGKADTDCPAIIRFFGPVDSDSTQRFIEEFLWLQDVVRPSKIIVPINSDGGSVMYGMSVYSIIQSCPIEVDCVIEGIAASMGSVIWAAGKNSYMHDYSILMIHNPFLYDEDESVKNMVEAFRQQIETVYHKRFGLSKEKVRNIMNGDGNADGTFFTAKQAVEAGIIPASNIIKTSKQVCDKVKNAIDGIKDIGKIRNLMNSIAEEIDGNKLPELVNTIPIQNKQEQQVKKTMEEKDKFSFGTVAAQLGFAENSPIAGVTNRIAELLNAETELKDVKSQLGSLQIQYKGKETEVKNLQDKLAGQSDELKKYKDAEKAAKDAEIANMVQSAIDAGKIEASAKDGWIAMANSDLELTKTTLASIPERDKISKKIATDPEAVKNANETLKTVEQKAAEKVAEVVGKNFELAKFKTA